MDDFRFPASRPELSLGFAFWQTTNLWQQKMNNSLKHLNLTHVQFVLLAGIGWHNQQHIEATQSMLAEHAKMDVMMTSKAVRTLEIKQLITRREHTTDTRAKSLLITDEGRELLHQALAIVDQIDQLFFESLVDQYQNFLQSLTNLIKFNREK